jgi:hypothetical protein
MVTPSWLGENGARMRERLKALLRDTAAPAPDPSYAVPGERERLARPLQLLLARAYQAEAADGRPPDFDEVGFNVYSATYEDGILLYIFSVLGMGARRCVDIGAGAIEGSNVANLIVNHGFDALLIDGDAASTERARRFYAAHPDTRVFPPRLLTAMVTAENIDRLLDENGFAGANDLFCIDVDGVDWWLWKAMSLCEPRVVVVEYQDILGPERAWTVPYRPDFDVRSFPVNRERYNYCGASLRAFQKLAREKSYRLVGCNRGGYNAFFVRAGLGEERLPEVSVESCFRYAWNQYGMRERFPLVEHMEWVEV